MGITAKDSGSDFVQAPAGTHLAICYGMIDLGTQHDEWQGKPIVRRQVILQWELPLELIDTDKGRRPAIVSRFYTVSMNEKSNLRPDLEAWRGRAFTEEEAKAFDITAVLGKACQLSIVHKEGKARVASIAGLMKGTTVPERHNDLFLFSFEDYDHQKFMALPNGIREIVERSDEYKAMMDTGGAKQAPKGEAFEDDVPF